LNTPTISQISQLCDCLTEGDKVRVLRFAEAIVASRTAKRRSQRHEQPERHDWRIGE